MDMGFTRLIKRTFKSLILVASKSSPILGRWSHKQLADKNVQKNWEVSFTNRMTL